MEMTMRNKTLADAWDENEQWIADGSARRARDAEAFNRAITEWRAEYDERIARARRNEAVSPDEIRGALTAIAERLAKRPKRIRSSSGKVYTVEDE
jgi:DNA-binding transcriptional MerR regulator